MIEEDTDELLDDITMNRGPAWVLVSVPSAGEDTFDVVLEVGPALDVDTVRVLLMKTLDAL